MHQKTFAIVGCGAAAVVFLQPLVKSCISKNISLNLMIFEPATDLGVGLAYQQDQDSLLVNRPLQAMSVNPEKIDDFINWMYQKRFLTNVHDEESKFVTRELFGKYLAETLEKTLMKALKNNIQIKIIKEYVNNIEKDCLFQIKTNSGRFFADYVVLCIGNNQPKDIYCLKKTPHYINSIYPVKSKLKNIGINKSVGIIGNSLTAIDAAVTLSMNGHLGKINMLSRSYFNLKVRGKITKPYNLKYFTKDALSKILQIQKSLSLRGALRLFRKELKENNFCWKSIFIEDDKNISFEEILRKQLNSAEVMGKLSAILSSTNQIIEEIWKALDDNSKSLYIKYFQRGWLSSRSPIPKQNADILLRLAIIQQLSVTSGLNEIRYNQQIDKYIASTDSESIHFDWIINASGPARYVQAEDKLLYNLIKNGLAQENKFGGVDVDFDTTALINVNNEPDMCIRLLGHNTSGVYNYISSLEMISKKSK